MDNNYEKMCCESAMKWYGWGSPVGAAIFFIGIGISALLMRFAIIGLR